MDADIDHYLVLGLPSGEQGFRLTEKDITTAYRSKALELHPDKRRDDPDAPANFLKLQTSYHILKDGKGRKLFDDLLRAKQQKSQREMQHDSKRRRMMSDLDQRERASFNTNAKATSEEEITTRILKEEADGIRKMHSAEASTPLKKESVGGERSSAGGRANVDNPEKMLIASWENAGFEYMAQSLKEIFEAFGEVKDVVILTKRRKGSSFIVMATKEAAVAATRAVYGDFSNPLLVAAFPTAQEPVNEELVDAAGFKAFEDSVLQKFQKAAETQK